MISNLFTEDLTTATPSDLEQAITQLAQSGIEEKFRLDFKETWDPDKQCPDIAGLANAYGGLLVLGVSNDRQRLPGIAPPKHSDLKTQVASVIATRISPVPVFEIHTCPAPGSTTTLLVLIRVAPQPRLHLVLKGEKPVYVRVEDKTVPASAAQLQALLDRVRNAERGTPIRPNPLAPVARDFFVSKANDLSAKFIERQSMANRTRSETQLMIGFVPEYPLALALEVTLEQKFQRLLFELYPSIGERRSIELGASVAERSDRSRSWYRYHYLDLDRDHEAVWAFSDGGGVQFACEVSERVDAQAATLWSLVDLFINLDSTLRLVHEFWLAVGYFGPGYLAATLSVPNLVPACSNLQYLPLFYQTGLDLPAVAARKLIGNYSVSEAGAEALVTYDGRTGNLSETLANVGNQLLRDLRFGVDTSVLREHLKTWTSNRAAST